MRLKKRYLHELPYTEIVKSGTVRLASVSGSGFHVLTPRNKENIHISTFLKTICCQFTNSLSSTLLLFDKYYVRCLYSTTVTFLTRKWKSTVPVLAL